MDLFKKSGTMNTTLKYSYLIIFLSALTGCDTMSSLFNKQHVVYNRNYDYLQSTTSPKLAVPPGVDGSQLGSTYVIPGDEYPARLQRTSLVPPGSMGDLVARGQLPASIIKSDVIPTTPLPSANSALSASQIQAYEAAPASLTPELASTASQAGTAAQYATVAQRRTVPTSYAASTQTGYATSSQGSLTPELASTAAQPGTHPATAMQATRATIAQANPQAGLVNSNTVNTPNITLRESPSTVWTDLGPALQQSGYKVLLQDRRVNIYYILDTSSTGGKVRKTTPMYQVHMTSINNRTTTLSVTDNTGGQIDSRVAQRVLSDIHRSI